MTTGRWAGRCSVLVTVTAMQGQTTDTLPLFDRALAVTQAEPALTDLRLLLQLNQAVTLGDLDRYEEAFAAAREARHLATLVGTVVRLTQAHCALGQLLFDTGQWADALAEVQALDEALKEPGVACCDLGIAAVICFHRGDMTAARQHLAAADPYARRIGSRVVAPLALARSLDREAAGDARSALAVLTAGSTGNAEELDEIEELVADAIRLACEIGDLARRKRSPATPKHLPSAPTFRTGRPTRCFAVACWAMTRPGCCRPRSDIPTAPGRYLPPRP